MTRIRIAAITVGLSVALTSVARASGSEDRPYPKNLVHIDLLAPLAEPGMYGGAYERVFSQSSTFGGPRSFLVAFAVADEIEIKGLTIDDVKATDLFAVGILVREYASKSLSGVYSQYGLSYITGQASGTEYDWRGQARHHEYDLNAGELQMGLGLQWLMARVFLIDVGISGRLSLGNLANKGEGEDTDDELLFGWSFALAAGVGFAF